MNVRTWMIVGAAMFGCACGSTQEIPRTDFYNNGFGLSIVTRMAEDWAGTQTNSTVAVSTDPRPLCLIMDGYSKYVVPPGGEVRVGGLQHFGGRAEVYTDLARCR